MNLLKSKLQISETKSNELITFIDKFKDEVDFLNK